MSRLRAAAAFTSLTLLAACGSTVPSAQRSAGLNAGDSNDLVAGSSAAAPGSAAEASGTASAGRDRAGLSGGADAGRARAGGRAASAAGTTSTTGSIELGFVNTNVSNAAAFGVNVGSTFSNQQIYDALIEEINKAGGINGRKIAPVYANTDTASANWNTDFQAACERFTKDHHVSAVLGYVFVWLESLEGCLNDAHVVHLYGGYQPGDRKAQHDMPLVVSTTHPDVDDAWLTAMGGAIASGRLTPANKLGIVVDTCAHGDRAFNAVVPAFLRAHHITYETFKTDCSAGSSDNGRAASDIQAAGLQFRSHGVDVVYVTGVPALLFAANAESQHWSPSYIMNDGGAAFEGNVPEDQLQNFHGFGWIPAVDVNSTHQPGPLNAQQQRCLSMLGAHGITPGGYNDYMLAYTSCDALFLYAEAVKAANGRTDAAALVPALSALSGRVVSTSTYEGRLQYTPNQHGGAAVWREWGYSAPCKCFVYVGEGRPLSW